MTLAWIRKNKQGSNAGSDRGAGGVLCRFQQWTDKRSYLIQLISIFVFRAALDLIYIISISKSYAYVGFSLDIDVLRYLLSWLTLITLSPFVAQLAEDNRPSGNLFTVIVSIYFIPMTSYYGCHGTSLAFFVVAMIYWSLMLLFQRLIPSVVLAPMRSGHVTILAWVLTIGSVLFVLYISGQYTGFRFTLDIINVYEIRAEAAQYDIPTIFAYLLSFMPAVLALLTMRWIERKNMPMVLILVVTYIFLFSISAQKSVFFFLLFSLACGLLYRHFILQWHRVIMSVVGAVSVLFHIVLGNLYPVSLIFRRLMYIPVQISEQIYQMMRNESAVLFRDSFLDKFGFSPVYSVTIPRVVGEYRGNMGENANNGLLGDMLINLPLPLGVFLMPLVLIGSFRILDLCAMHAPEKYCMVLCIYYAVSFSNSSWSTVLLSGGFAVASMLLYVFFNKNKRDGKL